jgi:hypothetical protein
MAPTAIDPTALARRRTEIAVRCSMNSSPARFDSVGEMTAPERGHSRPGRTHRRVEHGDARFERLVAEGKRLAAAPAGNGSGGN